MKKGYKKGFEDAAIVDDDFDEGTPDGENDYILDLIFKDSEKLKKYKSLKSYADNIDSVVDDNAAQKFGDLAEAIGSYTSDLLKVTKKTNSYANAGPLMKKWMNVKKKFKNEPDAMKQFKDYMKTFEKQTKSLRDLIRGERKGIRMLEDHVEFLYSVQVDLSTAKKKFSGEYEDKKVEFENQMEEYDTLLEKFDKDDTEAVELERKCNILQKEMLDSERKSQDFELEFQDTTKNIEMANAQYDLRVQNLNQKEAQLRNMEKKIKEIKPIYLQCIDQVQNLRITEQCLKADAELTNASNKIAKGFADYSKKLNEVSVELVGKGNYDTGVIQHLMDVKNEMVQFSRETKKRIAESNDESIKKLEEAKRRSRIKMLDLGKDEEIKMLEEAGLLKDDDLEDKVEKEDKKTEPEA